MMNNIKRPKKPKAPIKPPSPKKEYQKYIYNQREFQSGESILEIVQWVRDCGVTDLYGATIETVENGCDYIIVYISSTINQTLSDDEYDKQIKKWHCDLSKYDTAYTKYLADMKKYEIDIAAWKRQQLEKQILKQKKDLEELEKKYNNKTSL